MPFRKLFIENFKDILVRSKNEGIIHENRNKMSLKAQTEFNFRYSNQIKDLKMSVLELVRRFSFCNLNKNLIEKSIKIKEIHELNSREMIILKNRNERVKIDNDNLRSENLELKTIIKNLKNDKGGLIEQNIYLNKNRINLNYNFEKEQRKQTCFIQNLNDKIKVERNRNNLLM